jgi:hypothetical protein
MRGSTRSLGAGLNNRNQSRWRFRPRLRSESRVVSATCTPEQWSVSGFGCNSSLNRHVANTVQSDCEASCLLQSRLAAHVCMPSTSMAASSLADDTKSCADRDARADGGLLSVDHLRTPKLTSATISAYTLRTGSKHSHLESNPMVLAMVSTEKMCAARRT